MKTLIVYTSKSGVTKDVASLIENTLSGSISVVALGGQSKDIDLLSFDLIILGSPMYMGYLRKAMRRFVFENQEVLLRRPLALFVVGAHHQVNLDKYLRMSYPNTVVEHACIKSHLGGEFRFDEMGLFKRMLVRKIAKEKANACPGEVKIEQEAIATFSEEANKLLAGVNLE